MALDKVLRTDDNVQDVLCVVETHSGFLIVCLAIGNHELRGGVGYFCSDLHLGSIIHLTCKKACQSLQSSNGCETVASHHGKPNLGVKDVFNKKYGIPPREQKQNACLRPRLHL